MDKYLPILRDLAFFRGLPDAVVLELARCMGRVRIAPGDVLYKTGDPPGSAWVVARGSVQVLSPGGRPVSVARAGEALGLTGLFLDNQRDVTAVAAEETWLLRIDRETLEAAKTAGDRLGALLVERLAQLLAIMLRSVDQILVLAEAKQRARLTPMFVPVAEPLRSSLSSGFTSRPAPSARPQSTASATNSGNDPSRANEEALDHWIGEFSERSGIGNLDNVKVVYSGEAPIRPGNPLLSGRR